MDGPILPRGQWHYSQPHVRACTGCYSVRTGNRQKPPIRTWSPFGWPPSPSSTGKLISGGWVRGCLVQAEVHAHSTEYQKYIGTGGLCAREPTIAPTQPFGWPALTRHIRPFFFHADQHSHALRWGKSRCKRSITCEKWYHGASWHVWRSVSGEV